ncbi:MAG: RnfABCDGE type electron transport complex subunit D [Pseudomonadota bacterium]
MLRHRARHRHRLLDQRAQRVAANESFRRAVELDPRLAASVPASMPFLPMLFAVWIIKLPMTGLPLRFNAAMAGRLFLMLVYPTHVTHWGTPTADVISTATPQELYRSEGYALEWPQLLFGKIEGVWEELFLLVPGSPGETFPLIILLLGIILCRKGIMAWRTPIAFLLSFSIATWACGNSPLVNMFTASTLFSMVFIVSDPVSTPMSKSGQMVCGIIIGISNALIRHFTYYTEAIVYAVLLGNLCTPLLDQIAFRLQGWRLGKRVRA